MPERCPRCEKSFQGDPIPEEHRENFGGATHFSTVIAQSSWENDRVENWCCPFCCHVWPAGVTQR